MNKQYPTSLLYAARSFWRNRSLILRMTKREVIGRYQGSVFGLLWSFFNPVAMLAVYTFFFSVVFKARFGALPSTNKSEFAIILFAGLVIYNLFAECVNRAPTLILANPNYVKKVVFPLEILPWVSLGSALFHALVSLLVLFAFVLYLNHAVPWTLIYLPLILIPFVFLLLGIMWFLSAVSVFLRDISQIMNMVTMILLFLSPIFYSITSLPAAYRNYLYLNPLTFVVDQARDVMLLGVQPHWQIWLIYSAVALLVAGSGFWGFQKARKLFADVL